MTETSAIMKYLCERHKPELLGTTPEQRGHILMVENIITGLGSAFGGCYWSEDKESVITAVNEKMKPVSEFLGEKEYLIGANLSYVDFWFFELVCKYKALTGSKCFDLYPNLKSYYDWMNLVPQIKAYWTGPSWENLIYNNKIAKINFRD